MTINGRRQHKNRDREYQPLSDFVKKINYNEYNEVWNIYKLSKTTSDPDGQSYTEDLLLGDYVGKILGNLNTAGTNIVNNILVPAMEFVDPLTGNPGKIRLKNNGIKFISDPDVDSFFPKWLWKGFLSCLSPQEILNERVVYYLTKGEPIVNEAYQITKTDVYAMYASETKLINKNFSQTKLTLSYMDSNVAKSAQGQYVQMNFFTKPARPSNAKYVVLSPKTYIALGPRPIQVESDSTFIYPLIDRDNERNQRIRYNVELDQIMIKLDNEYSFDMCSSIWTEFKFQRELQVSLENSNITSSIGEFVAEFGVGAEEFNNNFIPSNDQTYFGEEKYRYILTAETVGVGTSDFEQSFIDYILHWRINSGDSNLSQIPKNVAFSEDTNIELDIRHQANWQSNASYFLADTYRQHVFGGGFIRSKDQISIYKIRKNDDISGFNDFYFNFLDGTGQINGLLFDKRMTNILTNNFVSKIEDINFSDNYFLVNSGNIDALFRPINWFTRNILAASAAFDENKIKLPDPDQTFAAGLQYQRELFTDTNYHEDYYYPFTFKIGEGEFGIDSFSINLIGGTFDIAFLDANGNNCLATNSDGDSVILSPIKLLSPQKISPLNTQIKIIFV